ncbi:Mediator complex [Babesia duncani]|uniref:Mediator of RNA polymerase II transcription subunit 14 n=1 Tax=Babesia duncani TaxID=323732 RepID=A0AAD9PLZ7_9APIC|nr:Mediator complex [Babesia duncani]
MISAEVPFLDILSQLVLCCVVDWARFCSRKASEDDYNKDQMRGALVQFCRWQRELFLKLYVLFEFSLRCKNLGKLIEGTFAFDEFLSKTARDLVFNVQKTLTSDLVVAPPGVSVAVDLLSMGSYKRMPRMLRDLAVASTLGSIPMVPLTNEEADFAILRLENEYRWLFGCSKCSKNGAILEINNGQCVLKLDQVFCMRLIYDFNTWQLLEAVPLFLQEIGASKDGEVKAGFQTILLLTLSSSTREAVFDDLFYIACKYVGKVLVEHLHTQALEFMAANLIVLDCKLQESPPEHATGEMQLDSANSSHIEGALAQIGTPFIARLDISCFPRFHHRVTPTHEDQNETKIQQGVTISFIQSQEGWLRVELAEMPSLFSRDKITIPKLDYWLEQAACAIETFQLEQLGVDNIRMCHASGGLFMSGLDAIFSLIEYPKLCEAIRMRNALLLECSRKSNFLNNLVPTLSPSGSHAKLSPQISQLLATIKIREIVPLVCSMIQCKQCPAESTKGDSISINQWLYEKVCDVCFPVHFRNSSNALHAAACLHVESIENVACIYSLMAHGSQVVGEGWICLESQIPRGILWLQSPLEFHKVAPPLQLLLKLTTQFFDSNPLGPQDAQLDVYFKKCQVSVSMDATRITVTWGENMQGWGSNDIEEIKRILENILQD